MWVYVDLKKRIETKETGHPAKNVLIRMDSDPLLTQREIYQLILSGTGECSIKKITENTLKGNA